MKYVDNKIDQFATYLQKKNNLDRIQFLQVRLGMQVVVSNLAKTIVVYSIAIILHVFWYTLATHLAYILIRINAHGAHAKSSLLCHIQNILIFVLLPWLVASLEIPMSIMYGLAIIGFIFILLYAPAATKKQPIPKRQVKRKQVLSIVMYIILSVIAIIFTVPYSQLILLGIIIESITLLPIFFPKEEKL